MKRLLPLALAILGLCIMPVSCTSTSDTGSEEMLPGKLTISTDDLDFADYGETKIRMTRD